MIQPQVFENSSEILAFLSAYIKEAFESAIADHGTFCVGLSGGSVVQLVSESFKQFASDSRFSSKAHIFFCDERYVPTEHADSNCGAYTNCFATLRFDDASRQIHRVRTELELEEAARDYEAQVRECVTTCSQSGAALPSFDLLFLGCGPDGHTCSLFPGSPLLAEKARLVVSIADSPKPPPRRVTFTLPLVNAARRCLFVCAGEAKADVVALVVASSASTTGEKLPAALIQPTNGEVRWLVDRGAASKLSSVQA